MAKLNVSCRGMDQEILTHEGGQGKRITAEQELRRSVMSCLLWEGSFYEDGQSVSDRIKENIAKVNGMIVSKIAVEAREQMKLRHVPLMIVREMARLESHKRYVADTLSKVIQRPDEITEFLALYWKDGRQPLSAQVKKGLAKAFTKFNEYSLAKYNGDNTVKLRDALFLCHARPNSKEQEDLWKRLINNELIVPDTWEINLSAGKDKKETWERLLSENKLGALALLRNLRNMFQVNVNDDLIRQAIIHMSVERVLPYRFISAAKYAPRFESDLETGMYKCIENMEKLPGKTVLLIDVSGSMDMRKVSERSDMTPMEAACGLAILARELCEHVEIYTFSNSAVYIRGRRGFALRDEIVNSQPHKNTYLKQSLTEINEKEYYDRIIVITDEQSQDGITNPKGKGYLINVATYKNGVGYREWTHIDGWSEATLQYIIESEKL